MFTLRHLPLLTKQVSDITSRHCPTVGAARSLDHASPSSGDMDMKQSEFRRWLTAHGATFKEGRKHTRVYLQGRQSTLPRHPSHEIGDALRKAIIRQLGL
jgi:mRNA interferase HicA